MNYNDPQLLDVTKIIFEEHFRRDPKLSLEFDDRRRKLMYDDIVYNLSYLLTAIHFSDEKIFRDYAVWIFELLCSLMKDLERSRIMEQLNDHYSIMSESINNNLGELLTKEEIMRATQYLESAIEATRNAVTNVPLSSEFSQGKHTDLRKAYLDALLTNQTPKAYALISESIKSGVTIEDLYEEVLSKVMHEIGELWHKSIITVDKEHYATSVTQTVMSQFYDQIFSQSRKNLTLLSCAVGSELHEIGVRMLSDIFEYNGWDTFYLGAALPQNAILQAIDEYKPNLIALSVTMPPHLKICEQIIKAIRSKYPDLLIAVGGQAFLTTQELWEKWDVNFYSPSAAGLLILAEEYICLR
jgi:methanogenic corrinoid protein MtbC1